MSHNPYTVPASSLSPDAERDLNISTVAKAQRLLLLGVLASLVSNALTRVDGVHPFVTLLVLIVVAAYCIWGVYGLCKALKKSPVIWMILMFIPLANLISLLILNSKATAFLKSNGVQVGLLGANL